ncbi:beta-ketoacyl-ACP synthase III [Pseudomonas sp. NPDC089734]|uniref:beta-ketoacyl-ACP synthase III n=1 Tax=Pseudomonas sp. NPDC089734 TaxID=3364469 RepID=UPI00380B4C65
MNASVYINRVATFLPGAPVSNDEMEGILGLVDGKKSRIREKILHSNGIQNRHYVIDRATGLPTLNNAQLTAEAVRNLSLEEATSRPLELLCCGTSTPDQILPSHASMVHGELGNPPCEVASFSGVCLSGLSSMKYGYTSILSGLVHRAVATGSELSSTFMQGKHFQEESESAILELDARPEIAFEKDFLRWMLSDGAGAVLLSDHPDPQGISLRIDWIEMMSYANLLPVCMYAGAIKNEEGTLTGWREFDSYKALGEQSVFSIKQDVKLLNEHVVNITVARGLQDILKKRALTPDEVTWFLPHYSSNFFRKRIYASLQSVNFEIPEARWFTNLERIGNIGAASLYFMLSDLINSHRLDRGDVILCFVPESGRFSTGFAKMTAV